MQPHNPKISINASHQKKEKTLDKVATLPLSRLSLLTSYLATFHTHKTSHLLPPCNLILSRFYQIESLSHSHEPSTTGRHEPNLPSWLALHLKLQPFIQNQPSKQLQPAESPMLPSSSASFETHLCYYRTHQVTVGWYRKKTICSLDHRNSPDLISNLQQQTPTPPAIHLLSKPPIAETTCHSKTTPFRA